MQRRLFFLQSGRGAAERTAGLRAAPGEDVHFRQKKHTFQAGLPTKRREGATLKQQKL